MANVWRSVSMWRPANGIAGTPSFVCKSCRSRIVSSHVRQFHESGTRRVGKRSVETPATTEEDPITTNPFKPGLNQDESLDQPAGTGLGDGRQPDEGDPTYEAARTAKGLEWVGTKKWVEAMRDPKDKFRGWPRERPANVNRENVDTFLAKIKGDAFGGSDISFDAASKLKLAESVSKITGVRIADIRMQQMNSVGALRAALIRRQKEPRFSDVFGQKQAVELQGLPNVSIKSTRMTMLDKEKERGRWKLIKRALLVRQLPVFKKNATKAQRLL
ncbi:hypothetical protein CAC42_8004 [Sphaceloma murrayae]|uniref:Uncharacterized protein n=1 Tax=Sphaceloma murrayae TaxID=2082308 RepID=A0A2K1QL61_9PEZI|nr:hypothetical protein CAC42_8004 [Sphaceloma murrayae]